MSEQVIHLDLLARAPARIVSCSSVSVRDILVAADIGVHTHEIGNPQPLIVSVTLGIQAPLADRIDQTIDYNSIVALAENLAKTRTGLIETFAYRLASACLDFPGVRSANVKVEKPQALGNGVASTRIIMSA